MRKKVKQIFRPSVVETNDFEYSYESNFVVTIEFCNSATLSTSSGSPFS